IVRSKTALADTQDLCNVSTPIFVPPGMHFKVVYNRKRFRAGTVTINKYFFVKALKMIAEERDSKMACLLVKCSDMLACLRALGISQITEDSQEGDIFGDFEVIKVRKNGSTLHFYLRYGRCIIELYITSLYSKEKNVKVILHNNDEVKID
ncbi:hypothetical protein PMAYCL1PPCAC_21213, partial [Pristionchus mayeri]